MTSLLSAAEAARLLGCHPITVRRVARLHNLGTYVSGRLAGLTHSDVRALSGLVRPAAGNPDWVPGHKKPGPGRKKAS